MLAECFSKLIYGDVFESLVLYNHLLLKVNLVQKLYELAFREQDRTFMTIAKPTALLLNFSFLTASSRAGSTVQTPTWGDNYDT